MLGIMRMIAIYISFNILIVDHAIIQNHPKLKSRCVIIRAFF